MSRVDIPTLKCDRCKETTQNSMEMVKYRTLHYYSSESTSISWDFCPNCWVAFNQFVQ